jgi:ATPase subunit of ABC transporter with duplicated ATPase domains
MIGENGVGKSTLLRRMAKQWVPGIPLHFRFGYVQQELPIMEDISVMNFIMKTTVHTVASLEREIADMRKKEMELDALMEVSIISNLGNAGFIERIYIHSQQEIMRNWNKSPKSCVT